MPPARKPGVRVVSRIASLAGEARSLVPGLLPVMLVSLAAAWLSEHYGAPVMLFALLLGMAINFLGADARCRPGVDFASRTILRAGVALLGMRITLEQIGALGAGTLVLTITAVTLTIAFGWLLARILKTDTSFGLLTGGSVAICGASAALAIAAILPQGPVQQRATIVTVVGVTVLSTVAMVLYPLVAEVASLDSRATGVFLGATIHDVAQVVGAGYSVSSDAGDTATMVKLLRVALLLPVVVVLSIVLRGGNASIDAASRPPVLPAFLVAFAVLVLVNTAGLLPPGLGGALRDAASWCLVLAISALGMKTMLGEILSIGWRSVAIIVAETVFVAALVLGTLLARA